MYPLLILFLGALVGITFMIGRKLLMIQNGEVFVASEEMYAKMTYAEDWKNIITQSLKAIGHITLVEVIRLYVRTTKFLKEKYETIKSRNGLNTAQSDKQEISKFLKIISQYKSKIRKIKERVKKEENNL